MGRISVFDIMGSIPVVARGTISPALGQGALPPVAFDARDAALVFDRLSQLLVDDLDLERGHRFVVPDGGEAEEIGRELRAVRMNDEGSMHSERSTEQPGLEDDVVSRRSLARSFGSGRGRSGGRPVVASKDERGEIDFMRKLEEGVQRGGPRTEGRRPGIHVRHGFETARQRLQQLLLLS